MDLWTVSHNPWGAFLIEPKIHDPVDLVPKSPLPHSPTSQLCLQALNYNLCTLMGAQCDDCDCILILMVKWKKIASSENGLDLWALSWPPAPHPLWSAFTLTTPQPSGVIREPPNGPAGCQPISHCLFFNQITIFNGDTSPGPSPNRHLFEIVARNYFTQKFSLCSPFRTPRPTLVFCLLLFVFSKNSPSELLMDRNKRGKWGVLWLGSAVVARVWLLGPLSQTYAARGE